MNVDAKELKMLRAVAAQLRHTSCVINYPSTVDSDDPMSISPVASAETTCRILHRHREQVKPDGSIEVSDAVAFLPYDADVPVDATLTIGGVDYRIVSRSDTMELCEELIEWKLTLGVA